MSLFGARSGARGCARTWEVEAARDGRLSARDVDSLMRHLAGCQSCQRRRARLDSLAAVLRDLPPLAEDALAARRARHRLFAEADRVLLQPTAKHRSSRWLVAGAGALAAAAVVISFLGATRFTPSPSAPVAAAPVTETLQIEVEAGEGAIWRKTRIGSQVRLELDSGEIRARIGERRPGQSLVIHLPDGEIEDLGTVLTVRVEQGRTRDVHVFEGRVRLRLAGRAPLELGAGHQWDAEPQSKPDPAQSCAPVRPPNTLGPRPFTPRQGNHHAVGNVTASGQARPINTAPVPSSQRTGQEDAAYLRVVDLVRAHRLDEARVAAKDYLLRFPEGFRREEVLSVATSVGR